MTVLVDRPSLAVDELLLIVTYTIMLNDFYTPSETMLCLCVYRILVYAQTQNVIYLSIVEQFCMNTCGK